MKKRVPFRTIKEILMTANCTRQLYCNCVCITHNIRELYTRKDKVYREMKKTQPEFTQCYP